MKTLLKRRKKCFEISMILLRVRIWVLHAPSFAGSSATQAPDANEMIWILKAVEMRVNPQTFVYSMNGRLQPHLKRIILLKQ